MTLRDPNNPGLWADGTPRSCGNAFDGALRDYRIDTERLERRAKHSRRATEQVNMARDDGRTLGVGALRGNKKHLDKPPANIVKGPRAMTINRA